MTIPQVTRAWLRSLAVAAGLPPEEGERYVTSGDWLHGLWTPLVESLPADALGIEAVRATRLEVDLSIGTDAMTDRYWEDDRPVVRVSFGLAAWARSLARAMTPFFIPPVGDSPVQVVEGRLQWATPGLDLAHTADALAYSLEWVTSRAGHPLERERTSLTETQRDYADRSGFAVLLFALAHELTHVRKGELVPDPGPASSRAREYAADEGALERIVVIAARSVGWPLSQVLPAVAIFFWASTLRWAYAAVPPSPDDTHPTPLDRLLAIDRQIGTLADPMAVGMFAGVAQAFEALKDPMYERSPDAIAPAGELQRVLDGVVAPEILAAIPRTDASPSWRTVYAFAVEIVLRLLADDPDYPLEAAVAVMSRWINNHPGLVIDALGAACDGKLANLSDPTPAVRDVALRIVPMLPNDDLREAILPG